MRARRLTRTLVLATLFAVTLIGVGSCALNPASTPPVAGQSTAPPLDTQDPWARFYRYRAFAAWSCAKSEPIVFVRVDIRMTPEEQLAVLRHEAAHVQMMLSLPDCKSFQTWASDAENRLTMEALGACAQVRQEVKDGSHPLAARARAASALAYSYGFRVSHERAYRRLMAVCPA